MNIYESQPELENNKTKTKKLMIIIGVAIVILFVLSIGLIFYISYIEKNKFNGNTFTFIQGTTTLKAKWEVIKIDPCIVNGTGVDACGTNQDSMPGTWVHLSKDIY